MLGGSLARDIVATLRASGDHPLISSFPQGAVFAFDRDLRYLAAGGMGLGDVGLSREALEGRTIFEAFPPETVAVIEPHYRAALDGLTTTWDVPYQGRVYAQRLGPVRDAEGAVVAGIGFTQDVTEARRTEQALRESEELNHLTFQNAPVGKAIVELDGRWRQVNAAVVELTGYSEDQLVGMTFQDITHPDDLQADLELVDRLLAGEIASYRLEKRYITASGRTVHTLLAVSLVRDHDGEPRYFIAQIQDITELVAKRQALQDLMSIISHDMRTALTVIEGSAALLDDLGPDATPEETQDHLNRIRATSRSVNSLLENALTATSSETGRLRPVPGPVDLHGLGDELVTALAPQLPDVVLDVEPGRAVLADRGQLNQVLTNLLTNAAKYGSGRITLTGRASEGGIELRVTDDGPGVDPEFVPHLFDRFTRSTSARSGGTRGSGLGLFIVKELTELNGGSVAYAGRPGGGAEFVLRFPALEAGLPTSLSRDDRV